jgi:hypothetical protein
MDGTCSTNGKKILVSKSEGGKSLRRLKLREGNININISREKVCWNY